MLRILTIACASQTLLLAAFLAFSSPAFAASATGAEPGEITELWSGSIYTSTYRAGVCVRGDGRVRLVLLLKQRNGNVDVYHFYGTMANRHVEASHPSGHHFSGDLISRDTVEGKIRLGSGMTVRLKGKRTPNIRVAKDCAPLD